jgi:TATA-box binding protein (TBP) (component of TFIID and TFIIIB)
VLVSADRSAIESVDYRPTSFAKGARTRPGMLSVRVGDGVVLLFRTGAVVSVGERSDVDAERCISLVGRALRRSGYDATEVDFRVVQTFPSDAKQM